MDSEIMLDLFARLRKMKTMLIDDDVFIRDSMVALFEGEGCELTAFETAEEALGELDRHPYDVIITDYRLPGIDGLELLKRIQDSQSHAMKILITAYGGPTVSFRAVKLGAQKIVEKPFTTKSLEKALTQMIIAADQKHRARKTRRSG